jgi:pyruvate/2-oxoglutarate/acetoin dehydrogenase E1 component
MRVSEALNRALHQAMADRAEVVILGEDVLDPYGGAFKITRGLSTAHPDRVITTPVSEAGLVGVANGMALRGLRPVVEIMFGDFTPLIADQIINHATKFGSMYGRSVPVPLVVRTPMGGRRGYGPTHSQTLDKLWLGVPNLSVVAPNAIVDPGAVLRAAIDEDHPTMVLEDKLLYTRTVWDREQDQDVELVDATAPPCPTVRLAIRGGGAPSLTITAYGHMAELAREAIVQLAYEFEVFAELIVPTRLSPFDADPLLASLRRTGALLTVEEGTRTLGWGTELLARATEARVRGVRSMGRVAAPDGVIPSAPSLEELFLPQVDTIVKAALELA